MIFALLFFASHAHAQVAPPIVAEISASSGHVSAAFDADTRSSWCRAASDDSTGGAITIRFAEPVVVRTIAIYGADGAEDLAPIALTVTSDAGTATAALDPVASDATNVTLAGSTRTLTFHLPPRAAGPRVHYGTCLSEIDVHPVDRAWVYGVTPEAALALPAAIDGIEDALRSCDPRELATIARFPVRFRDTDPAQPRAYEGGPSAFPHGFPRASDLPCQWGFDQDERPRAMPSIDGPIAPGVVRVIGGEAITRVYWELRWLPQGWRLVAIDSAFFE